MNLAKVTLEYKLSQEREVNVTMNFDITFIFFPHKIIALVYFAFGNDDGYSAAASKPTSNPCMYTSICVFWFC